MMLSFCFGVAMPCFGPNDWNKLTTQHGRSGLRNLLDPCLNTSKLSADNSETSRYAQSLLEILGDVKDEAQTWAPPFLG